MGVLTRGRPAERRNAELVYDEPGAFKWDHRVVAYKNVYATQKRSILNGPTRE